MHWLSKTDEAVLCALTVSQKEKILFGFEPYDGTPADVALLLGCHLEAAPVRIEAAAALYHAGKVPVIVCCGGVVWPNSGEPKSESAYLREGLLARGVPDEAVLLENDSRNTRENFIFATACVERALAWRQVRRVLVVSAGFHLRRSLAWARLFLPRFVTVAGYPAYGAGERPGKWPADAETRAAAEKNLALLRVMALRGEIADIAYD